MVVLGIVTGSTRPGRVGGQVSRWARQQAALVPGLDTQLLDLAEIALPMLDEEAHPSERLYTQEHTRRWSAQIDALDAVLLVTPEYNYSFPAPLKNALDFLSHEWQRKPVAMVGYGMTSSGTRAVAALAPVVAALRMPNVGAVYLPVRRRVDADGAFGSTQDDDEALRALLGEVVEMAQALRPTRLLAS
jgi:NAD(P)H-dependent FMN reductase